MQEDLRMKQQNFLDDLFENSERFPDRIAVVDCGGTRSADYHGFASLIRRTTAKIEALHLPKGSFIIVNMGRCREYLAAAAAIICSGNAVIPLVPETPLQREAYISEEAKCRLRIEESFFADIDAYPESDGTAHADTDIAMMVYTSGSTGRPKGVYYSFKMLSACFQAMQFILEGIDPIIYASSIAYSFAAISVDTFSVFCAGGTMHILSDEVRKDVRLMNEYYRKHGITVGNVHPRMHRLLDGGDQLRRIFTSGHRLNDFWSDRFEIYLGYGLAETFAVATFFPVNRAWPNTPVGKACRGYQVMVCDENGNEVKDGVKGEVRISGLLAEGYYGMPELTAETFEKRSDGTVLLHTHDIGYKDENGDLCLVNRNDWLIKINGMSVNPAEIDYAMNRIPGIRESAAKGFADERGNPYICDFYVSDDASLTEEFLREQLGASLMPYMIPSVFVKMDRLPQTISAKVDYAALKAPAASRGRAVYEAPANETEARICRAFETLFSFRVGRNDDFVKLGGDSLSVLELLMTLNERALSVRDVMRLRTPSAIAAFLKEAVLKEPEEPEIRDTYELTPMQMRYYALCENTDGITIGNVPLLFRLDETYRDANAVREALYRVLKAHPAFSTIIEKQADGTLRQRFDPDRLFLPDLRRIQQNDLDRVTAEYYRPFTLCNSLLYRAAVMETEEGIWVFLDTHHIICDAFSVSIVKRDLLRALAFETLREDHYRQYLAQMSHKSGHATVIDRSYVTHLPSDSLQGGYGSVSVKIPSRMYRENILHGANGEMISVQTAVLAGTLLALRRETGSDRVRINCLVHGRDTVDKNDICGLLMRTLPVKMDFSGLEDAASLLSETAAAADAAAEETEAFVSTLSDWRAERNTLTVNCIPPERQSLPGIAEERDILNRNSGNTCDCYLLFFEQEDHSALVQFKYNATLYDQAHILRFAEAFFRAAGDLSGEQSWLVKTE